MVEERRRGLAEILDLEQRMREDIHDVKTDIAVIKIEQKNIRDEIDKLVTIARFRPVEMLTYAVVLAVISVISGAWLGQYFHMLPK